MSEPTREFATWRFIKNNKKLGWIHMSTRKEPIPVIFQQFISKWQKKINSH